MDFYGVERGTIRAGALTKLAKLSLTSEKLHLQVNKDKHNIALNIERISNGIKFHSDISAVPMTKKEFEILICLAESCSFISDIEKAQLIFDKLKLYFMEVYKQAFTDGVVSSINPNPWDLLTKKLTVGLSWISIKFPEMSDPIVSLFNDYLAKFEETSSFEVLQFFSLYGFLTGLSETCKFFTTSDLKGQILLKIIEIIELNDNALLKNVEDVSSNTNLSYFFNYQVSGIEFSSLLICFSVQKLFTSVFSEYCGNDNPDVLCDYLLEKVSSKYDEQKEYEMLSDIGSFDNEKDESLDNGYVAVTGKPVEYFHFSQEQVSLISSLRKSSLSLIQSIDKGADFISLSTSQRVDLCYASKAVALQTLSLSIYQDYLTSDDDIFNKIMITSLSHPHGLNNYYLSTSLVSLSALAIFKDSDSTLGSLLVRIYSLLISTPDLPLNIARDTARSLGLALKVLPQDMVISTIYSIINLISATSEGVPVKPRPPRSAGGAFETSVNISNLSINSTTDSPVFSDLSATCDHIFKNAVTVVVEIVKAYDDSDITTLVVTMFSQKIEQSSYLVPLLTDGLARCAPYCQDREFVSFTRLFSDLLDKGRLVKRPEILTAVTAARIKISELLLADEDNNLYSVYLNQLLRGIVNMGDVQKDEQHHRSHTEISEVAHEISQFLKPLALLLPDTASSRKEFKDSQTVDLFKNAWFNLVVHGYTLTSDLGVKFEPELKRIAHNSPPLASESSWNRTETSLELNSVLRRGSSNHNIKQQREYVDKIFDTSVIELRTLSTSKIMFLSAAAFLETLRVKCGDFSTVLLYFSDPTIKISGVERFIGSLAVNVTQKFVSFVLTSKSSVYKIENIAEQLKNVLLLCCHRNFELQDAAFQCCDVLINRLPSSLCHHVSLFTLLDLLTLLYQSILDADTNVYDPKFVYELSSSNSSVILSDSLDWRKKSLRKLYDCATKWVKLALLKCNMDIKALLQAYIPKSGKKMKLTNSIQLGVSFALDMGSLIIESDKELANVPENGKFKEVNTISGFLANWSNSYTDDLVKKIKNHFEDTDYISEKIHKQLAILKKTVDQHIHVPEDELTEVLEECTGLAILSQLNTGLLVRYIVGIPFAIFSSFSFKLGVRLWMTLIKERPDLSTLLLLNVALFWERSIKQHKGLFSTKHDLNSPESSLMEYTPSDKHEVIHEASVASRSIQPHLQVIYFLQSHLEATMYQSDYILKIFTRAVVVALERFSSASYHPFARLARFELIYLALRINRLNHGVFSELILDASLDFFKAKGRFPHGSNKLKIKTDYSLLINVATSVKAMRVSKVLEVKRVILLAFLDDEINNIGCFLNPINPVETRGKFIVTDVNEALLSQAFHLNPRLAINLSQRFKIPAAESSLASLLAKHPLRAFTCPEAVKYMVQGSSKSLHFQGSHCLLFFNSLCVIDAINLLISNPTDSIITQLAVRSLSENINISFFYVPQIVQALRYDESGYVEKFILETAKVSQLFAHQIIWNMNANKYLGDDGDVEDSLKPTLDAVQKKITSSLTEEDLEYYQREFSFFEEVTGISGKLKPYIKKTKAEKKAKIDEEMSKIEVLKDVYLPSNPDGVVVDINRKSGKPLQSHAKAPFMATFRIKKEVKKYEEEEEEGATVSISIEKEPEFEEKWMSAIFKVGDDCRQDVLALQLISVFRTIWMNAGLDLYVFPYRVTATSPGCGVIDVLPNSISRDMLGREAVNGLYQYFITKFGPETSIEFQNARNNFVKSLAAYSVISYIFQFKDRHNGNIMYDDQGHILHIDFGFIFDIVPGGVKFEQSPFKLTKEMVDVMGGNADTQSYRWFEELCVKAFLAVRPHTETIIGCIIPMMDSGLPCFKPSTINNLRNRFAPGKSEKEASQFMRRLIRKSYESLATKGYDEFQRLTNGIPY